MCRHKECTLCGIQLCPLSSFLSFPLISHLSLPSSSSSLSILSPSGLIIPWGKQHLIAAKNDTQLCVVRFLCSRPVITDHLKNNYRSYSHTVFSITHLRRGEEHQLCLESFQFSGSDLLDLISHLSLYFLAWHFDATRGSSNLHLIWHSFRSPYIRAPYFALLWHGWCGRQVC